MQLSEKSSVWNFESHSHDFIEILYFASGHAKITTPGKEVNLSFYEAVFYPEGVSHKEKIDLTEYHEVLCLGVRLGAAVSLDTGFYFPDSSGNFSWCLKKAWEEYAKGELANRALVESLVTSALHYVVQEINDVSSDFDTIVGRCYRYICENYAKKISINELAALNYISASYLSRLIKREFGVTTNELINLVRIENAKRLIKYTDLGAEEISTRCGFSDVKYFGKRFKSDTGMTLGEYKKSCKI